MFLKSIYNTAYENILAINSLNYARNFLLTLAETDHVFNQLETGSRKLKSNVSTILQLYRLPM